jgi:hypothetical protein
MNQAVAVTSTSNLQPLIAQLESMICREDAVDALVGYGPGVIPSLAKFLLYGKHRTIAMRVARARTLLRSQQTVLAYFKGYKIPEDLSVLFAEDPVRSTVAFEPRRWKSRHKPKQFFDVCLQLKNPHREESCAVFPTLSRNSNKCLGRAVPIKE